jgi:hypothetical protein
MKRRRLRGVVFAILAMCTLIIMAAVASRMGHAGNTAAAAIPTFPAIPPAPLTPVATAQALATTTAPPTPPAAADTTTGTIRIERPASPGHVWLDGKKLSAASAPVSCGTHQVKIGRTHARSIQVPCGGELVVSR